MTKLQKKIKELNDEWGVLMFYMDVEHLHRYIVMEQLELPYFVQCYNVN